MRLIIGRAVLSRIICRRAWSKRISIPSRRTHLRGIRCPICISIGKIAKRAVRPAFQFQAILKAINKGSTNVKIKAIYPRDLSNDKSSNHHPENNQYKSIAPNKLKDLNQSIQRVLQFTSASYFHRPERTSLLTFRITQIPLKIRKNREKISEFLRGIRQKSNTVRELLHFNKRIEK